MFQLFAKPVLVILKKTTAESSTQFPTDEGEPMQIDTMYLESADDTLSKCPLSEFSLRDINGD